MNYDSKADTLEHIHKVRDYLNVFVIEMLNRGKIHDKSKLSSEEKNLFDKYTPLLKNLTYGSQEYKDSLAALAPALQHHYKHNSHHPEYYKDGVNGMDLFDLIEMFCDHLAAAKRHNDGDPYKSLEINRKRFNYSDQLYNIFKNTLDVHLDCFD